MKIVLHSEESNFEILFNSVLRNSFFVAFKLEYQQSDVVIGISRRSNDSFLWHLESVAWYFLKKLPGTSNKT